MHGSQGFASGNEIQNDRSGLRPTNGISIEFEIRSEFGVL